MKKFIKTTDSDTANKMIAFGFRLVSHIGSVYTFLNDQPNNMVFESVDQTKIVYDDKLSL